MPAWFLSRSRLVLPRDVVLKRTNGRASAMRCDVACESCSISVSRHWRRQSFDSFKTLLYLSSKFNKAQGADEGGAREGIYIDWMTNPVNGPQTRNTFLFSPSSRRHRRHVFNHMLSARRSAPPKLLFCLFVDVEILFSSQLGLEVRYWRPR